MSALPPTDRARRPALSGRMRLWLGLAPTAAFLALLFLLFIRSDYGEWLDALADANYVWLAPGIAVYFGSFYLRSLRWRFLLRPFVQTSAAGLYPVVIVGYMANNMLPLRAGEFVRSYYLSRREPVSSATALATIIVERVFDGVLMLLLLLAGALFLPFSGLPESVRDTVAVPLWAATAVMVAPFVAGFAVIIVAAQRPHLFRGMGALIARRSRLPIRYRALIRSFVSRFVGGFQGLQKPGRIAKVAAFTLPVWIAEGVTYYLIALGFGLDTQLGGNWMLLGSMLVVISLANLAISVPLSQGGVGPFEIFAALGLVALGADAADAAAYAIVLHAALLLPVIVVGLVYLAARSIPLVDLLQSRARPSGKGSS